MASHTRNRWTQDTANTDAQIPVGIGQWGWGAETPPIDDATLGDGFPYYYLATASVTYTGTSCINDLIRTGMYATPNLDQQQFGTAALQPGPSTVSGTSDPLGIKGFPPYTNANNPINNSAISNIAGPVKKGFQVNWVDVIYATGANAITSVNFGLSATNFVNNTAPNAQAIIAYGTNSLPTTAQSNPFVTRITVASPAFYTLTDTFFNAIISFVTEASASIKFFGCIFGVSFNFN